MSTFLIVHDKPDQKMEPKLKRRRIQKKQGEENDVPDRLSCLPDSIVSHILSFLDTKTSIRTSVLSKKCKLLWTLSRSLDFKLRITALEGFDQSCGHVSSVPALRNSRALSFKSYVDRVLQLREHSDLTSFRLSMHNTASNGLVESCVDYAAKHKVQSLKICTGVKDGPIVLPETLMTSSSLISLNLHDAICKSIELPKSVALPNLKELRLKKFEFCSTNFNGEIFSGCPSLETLVLSKCWIKPGDQLKILDVSCPNLVRLEIKCWRSPWRCFDEHAINVDAPKLVFFTLQGHLARVNFVQDLLSLNEGNILLSYPSACATANGIERKRKTAEICINLLHQIRSVKSLSISLKAVEIISTLRDLRLHGDFIFEKLKFIKVTAGNKYVDTMRIDEVDMRTKAISGFVSSDTTKERRISPKSLRSEVHSKSAKPVTVPLPASVLQFLIENSPSAKLLTLELPKAFSLKRTSLDQ